MWSNVKEHFSVHTNLNCIRTHLSTNFNKIIKKLRDTRDTQEIASTIETDPEIDCLFTKNNLNEVISMTNFSRQEVQLIYRNFKQNCPSGYLTEEFIVQIYSHFFPLGNTEMFGKHLYSALSQNMESHQQVIDCESSIKSLLTNKRISFYDFMRSLAIISNGSIDEKIRWLFQMYDLNKDGLISHDEIESMINSIYDLMGESIDRSGDIEERNKHYEYVIEVYDYFF